jgi:hypothetical protein
VSSSIERSGFLNYFASEINIVLVADFISLMCCNAFISLLFSSNCRAGQKMAHYTIITFKVVPIFLHKILHCSILVYFYVKVVFHFRLCGVVPTGPSHVELSAYHAHTSKGDLNAAASV